MQAGADFQNRVGAWISALILAGANARSPWDLPADVTLSSLRSETDRPTDDLMVTTSANGELFVQAKRSLSLSESDRDLTSTMEQFVRQMRIWRDEAVRRAGCNDPLLQHRLVLAVSDDAPNTIKRYLPNMLIKLRGREAGRPPDAMLNNQERRAYRIVGSLIERAWVNVFGCRPSDDEILQLLDLIRVDTFDLDAGGRDELQAKDRLRTAVLRNPSQDDAAWNALVTQIAQFAKTRTGGDYQTLSRVLSDAGITLQVPRVYRDDVERLKQYSSRTLDILRDRARFTLGSNEVRIERDVSRVLREELEAASILVVGDPGSGKSVALAAVASTWVADGRDVVVIAADSVRADTLGQLRDEIGLSRDILEVLENWPSAETGLVVIDALDAVRTDQSARILRDLIAGISRLEKRWRVVASVRSFDLRYGDELKRLFGGPPAPEFSSSEFAHVHHVFVPPFSDDELQAISEQFPPLGSLIAEADDDLMALLRVPFNLHLAAELIDAGVALPELSRVQTQLQLLDIYWRRRVLEGGHGGERESVLRQVTESMVRHRRLSFDRREIVDPYAENVIRELLHAHVLIEGVSTPSIGPSRGLVAFTHNILFDYAVATLMLETQSPNELAESLADKRDLAIALRPSLYLHFQRAWDNESNRQGFWALVLRLQQAAQVPEIGKLIGPTVAAENAKGVEDFRYLIEVIRPNDATLRNAAVRTLRHVVSAVLAKADPHGELVGPHAGPWSALVNDLLEQPTPDVVWAIRPLIYDLYNAPANLTDLQLAQAGEAARRLLAYAQSMSTPDLSLVAWGLRGVARTYQSDPEASASLIRETLKPSRLTEFGYEEIPALTNELGFLIAADPQLVEEIYRAALTFEETSRAATHMGDDILGFSSNRQQDYDLGLHSLEEAFPEFLEAHPLEAMRVIDVVVDKQLNKRGHAPTTTVAAIPFGPLTAYLRSDGSARWDGTIRNAYADPNTYLAVWQTRLEALSAESSDAETRRAFIETFFAEPRPACMWRRLLIVAAGHPRTLGSDLLPLASSIAGLLSADTIGPAVRFVASVFPQLDEERRSEVEQALLAIPSQIPGRRWGDGEKLRGRLVALFPLEALVTGEARKLHSEYHKDPSVSQIEDDLDVDGFPDVPPWIPDPEPVQGPEGLDVEVLDLVRTAVERATTSQHGELTNDQAAQIESGLIALRAALNDDRQVEQTTQPRLEEAWQRLAEAASRIAFSFSRGCPSSLGSLTKALLLESARFPGFQRTSGSEDYYDRDDGVSALENPRAMAAHGLLRLAFWDSCVDEQLVQTIETLSGDKDPAVRLVVASELYALSSSATDVMWRILEKICRSEERWGVVFWTLKRPLHFLVGVATDRVTNLAADVYLRAESEGPEFVRNAAIELLVDTYLRFDHPRSQEVLDLIAAQPATHADDMRSIAWYVRQQGGLVSKAEGASDANHTALRARAFDLLERIVRNATAAIRDLFEAVERRTDATLTPEEERLFEGLMKSVDAVVHAVYFASGAHDERSHATAADDLPLPREMKQRFYDEAGTLLDALAEFGQPRIARYLLLTYEAFVSLDPLGIWQRIAEAIRRAKMLGVQNRKMVADHVVELVERYLADYRAEIWENEQGRAALVDILDGFVEVGWPSAVRLAYRLDQIYR